MRQHRPQRTPAQQVHMNVINLLPAMTVSIHDQAVAVFGNAFLPGKFCRDGDHTAQRLFVLRRDIINRWDQGIRDDQNVRGRLRRNIAKCGNQFILVNDIQGISRRIILLNIVSSATTFFLFSKLAITLRHATPSHTASIEYERVTHALSTLTHDLLSKKSVSCCAYTHFPLLFAPHSTETRFHFHP